MRRIVLATIAVLVLGAMTWPTSASSDRAVPVPKRGKVKIQGHGYGHGHGMSQYGAQGAARKGKSYRQILRFYYPHTEFDRTNPVVRVLISADTTRSVTVLHKRGLKVRDLGDGKKFRLPNLRRSNRWRLMPAAKNRRLTKIQYKRDGRWHRWNLPGSRTLFKGDAEFVGAGAKTLILPGGERRAYRGFLRSASPKPSSKTRDTVNLVYIDTYIRGVIAAEMPASWKQAALRAQAVAARSYAAHQHRANKRDYYQLCDTTACQVYRGASAETSSTNRAVSATKHKILTYRGRPALTQFSSSSGGWTSDGGFPYLPAKRDPWDRWSGNHVHTWKRTIRASTIERAYPQLGNLKRVRVLTRNGHGSWGGRVLKVRLNGSKKNVTITGNTMRGKFGLRSNWFRFR